MFDIKIKPFKCKNICELCDIIKDREKGGKIMVKQFFVIHREFIDVFHNKLYIPTIEKVPFILIVLGLLVQRN